MHDGCQWDRHWFYALSSLKRVSSVDVELSPFTRGNVCSTTVDAAEQSREKKSQNSLSLN